MKTTERIIELLYRNLQEVFGEGDAACRRAAIDELYTDDCLLYVPPGVFAGRDTLDKFAGDLRATHPQFAYTPGQAGPDTPSMAGLFSASGVQISGLKKLATDH